MRAPIRWHAEARRMRAQGHDPRRIAAELGSSLAAVRYVLGPALVQTAGSGPAMMSAELPEGGNGQADGRRALFEGRHFDREVIILCVRWYLRFKLSLRDLVKMMAERGLSLAHTTIMRWVWRYAPEFEKRWKRLPRRSAGHGRWTRPTSKFEAMVLSLSCRGSGGADG